MDPLNASADKEENVTVSSAVENYKEANQNELNVSDAVSDLNAKPKENSALRFLKELPVLVFTAFVIAFLIRSFIFDTRLIPSGSMEPTLLINDHLFVNKFMYRFTEPSHGDVVVFRYPLDKSKDYVKRLIGEAGDTIELKSGRTFVNGKRLNEPYLPSGIIFPNYGPVKVPKGEYFVMGDNRNNSSDSRVWGMVPDENILGKAVLMYWPLNRVGLIK